MRRSCARATLAAFFVWWELLGAQPLMPDFLGSVGGAEDQGESIDYLGRAVSTAFKSQPALPAGGGAPGASAAPPSVAGAGTVVGGGAATGGGGAGGAAGPTTLAQIARALGISVEALKTSDWARKVFGGADGKGLATSAPTGQTVAGSEGVIGSDLEGTALLPGESLEALVSAAMADPSVAGISGVTASNIAGAAGLGGSALGLAGTLSGNPDVARAGQLAGTAGTVAGGISTGTAAGTSGAAAGAGVGAGTAGAVGGGVLAGLQQAYDIANRFNRGDTTGAGLEAGLFTLGLGSTAGLIYDMAQGSDAGRIESDVRSAKNVLGAKVPAAISRLGKTLTDISSLDPASATTEQLLAAQQSLQAARTEFNAVDQAFKGGITVAGKPINTGLTLDMVKPQLDALNESQLRIQDALESRGIKSEQIPGYQSPIGWLNFVNPEMYRASTGRIGYDAGGETPVNLSLAGADADPVAYANYARDPAYYGLDPNDPTLALYRQVQGIQPGGTEAGLRGLTRPQAAGPQAAGPREPDPSAPMVPETMVARAFGGGAFGGSDEFGPVVSAMDAP